MPAPHPRSALALDVGRRRIGLAGCDALGLTVTPLPPLARGRFEADLPRLEGRRFGGGQRGEHLMLRQAHAARAPSGIVEGARERSAHLHHCL